MAFQAITDDELVTVAGGKATSQADLQLTQMLNDISSTIEDANAAKAKGATDPMQLMMTMMMLGGMGGGGGAATAPPPPAQPTVEQPAPNVVRIRV